MPYLLSFLKVLNIFSTARTKAYNTVKFLKWQTYRWKVNTTGIKCINL